MTDVKRTAFFGNTSLGQTRKYDKIVLLILCGKSITIPCMDG